MSPRLLAQLAWVFQNEAEARCALDDEEAMRLDGIARELSEGAALAGHGTGTDHAFGKEDAAP